MFPNASHFIFLSILSKFEFLKCANSLQLQCFILKDDQNFKSSPKIKFSHYLVLLYSKL